MITDSLPRLVGGSSNPWSGLRLNEVARAKMDAVVGLSSGGMKSVDALNEAINDTFIAGGSDVIIQWSEALERLFMMTGAHPSVLDVARFARDILLGRKSGRLVDAVDGDKLLDGLKGKALETLPTIWAADNWLRMAAQTDNFAFRIPQVAIEGGSWALGPGSAPRVDGSYGMDGAALVGAECRRNWLLRRTDVNQGIVDGARFMGNAPGALLDEMQGMAMFGYEAELKWPGFAGMRLEDRANGAAVLSAPLAGDCEDIGRRRIADVFDGDVSARRLAGMFIITDGMRAPRYAKSSGLPTFSPLCAANAFSDKRPAIIIDEERFALGVMRLPTISVVESESVWRYKVRCSMRFGMGERIAVP